MFGLLRWLTTETVLLQERGYDWGWGMHPMWWMGGAWGIGMMVLSFGLGAAALIFCLWALIDAIQNPALDGTMRIVWVLVILLTNVLGAILYLLMGRGGKRATG